MRLLLTADAVGGVWQYATTLAAGLPQHGIEVLLAVLGPAPDPAQRAAAERLPGVTVLPTGLPLDWLSEPNAVRAAGTAVAQLARDHAADVVHLNSPALAAHARFAQPVVAMAHGCLATWWDAAREGPLDPAFRWHEAAMAAGLRAADRTIAPSAAFADALARRYRLSAPPLVVHNGRDGVAPPVAGAAQAAVLTVGRLWDPVKNAALLDAVAARLAVPFLAAGATTGPHGETAALRHLRALGHVSDEALAGLLARRPIFASAASFEPFGLAALEAALAGCALVLADIPTFRELWSGAASFVPVGDGDGFAAAIEDLLADPDRRHEAGTAAQRRAASYSAEQMTRAMAAHYRALLASGRQALESAA